MIENQDVESLEPIVDTASNLELYKEYCAEATTDDIPTFSEFLAMMNE